MQTPGEILKHQRQKLGKTIFEVSQETKILEKYIKQIEENQFEQFDSPVFARGFTKIYADFLGLDVDKVLALFRRENKEVGKLKKKKRNISLNIKELLQPSKLAIVITSIFFLTLAFYFTFLYFNFQKQPEISIFTPIDGYISEQETITIQGEITKKSILSINNQEVDFQKNFFKYDLKLSEGVNNIEVKAMNSRNNKKFRTVILQVTFKPKAVEKVEASQTLSSFKATLKVKNEATWVKLTIDENPIYAQVLKSGFSQKFSAKSSIEVVSGKPENTELLIDGNIKELQINSKTGVASIECKVENSIINCSK